MESIWHCYKASYLYSLAPATAFSTFPTLSDLSIKPIHLVKGVGARSPPGEEQAQADSLKDAGKSANSDGLSGTLLGEDLGNELYSRRIRYMPMGYQLRGERETYRGRRAGHEDQGSEVGGSLV